MQLVAPKDFSIRAINQRLRLAKIGVAVSLRGERQPLRATLPPRPGSGKDKPYQQYLSLGIYANPAGLQRAERKAHRLGLLLAEGKFDWELYLRQIHDATETESETVAYWLERFKAYCLESVLKTDGLSEEAIDLLWRRRYVNLGLGKLDPGQPLTPELLISVVNSKKANSRSRQLACQVLGQFAKFAGVEVDLAILSGSYSCAQVVKELPSDDEIIAAIDAIANPQWQYIAALMATYGSRDHEAFLSEILQEDGDWIARVPENTKTGFRDVYPCPVEWVDRWRLYEPRLPQVTVRLNDEYGDRTSKAFKRQRCPFTPYTLRHANAVRRSVGVGVPIKIAADDMGHSPEVHLKVYSWHLSKAQRKEAYRRANKPV